MNAKQIASLKTFGKYIFWTAVGAVVTAISAHIGDALNLFNVPATWMPVIASTLGGIFKAIATYATTKAQL